MMNRKLKVMHVLNAVGGVKVYLDQILENIDFSRFDITVVRGKGDDCQFSQEALITEFRIDLVREISVIQDFRALTQLIRRIRAEKPDLIHCHSAKAGVIGRIAAYRTGVKVLYTPHAFSYLSTGSRLKRWVYLQIERLLASRKSVLLATSPSEQKRAIEEVGYREADTRVFHNSVRPVPMSDSGTFPPKSWPDTYICTVGRPSYQKNISCMVDIVDSLSKDTDIHLVVMGVGFYAPENESVKEKIAALGLESRITLLPWCDRNEVLHIIRHSKMYISTSRYEGLPYSVIEALALAKPCVVSDCDGNRDLIRNDMNGFIVPQGDIAAFTEKIRNILDDGDLAQRLSSGAAKTFSEHYDITTNIRLLEALYLSFEYKTI